MRMESYLLPFIAIALNKWIATLSEVMPSASALKLTKTLWRSTGNATLLISLNVTAKRPYNNALAFAVKIIA